MPESDTAAREYTERGFRVFGRVRYRPTALGREANELRVQESSVACEGPHCWVFANGDASPHLRPDEAEVLALALLELARAARAGELTEKVP